MASSEINKETQSQSSVGYQDLIGSLLVNGHSRYLLINHPISLDLFFKNLAPSIDWSLRKVFVKENLDLTVRSCEAFLSWRQQFNNFVGADIKVATIP